MSSAIFVLCNTVRLLYCKTLLFFIFLLIYFSPLSSQPYYFKHYQVENGLSNNAVICSLQDKKGFLWFGTKDGLNRFDGYTFKTFRNDPDDTASIGSNFIHSLHEDKNGTLWVGTETGLYQYDATFERFRLLKNEAIGQIRDIQMDAVGNLWFIAGFTLVKYNGTNKKLDYYNVEQYDEATSIDTSAGGTLWVATTSGWLKRYHPASNTFSRYDVFQHSAPAVSKWIEKIQGTTNGFILIGTSTQGAKMFNLQTSTYNDILTYNPNKTEIFVRNFVQTAADEFWMATESGIYVYNLTTKKSINLSKAYNDPYSVTDNAVYTFCKDKEGGIWVGTYFGGINYHPKQYTFFKKFFPKEGENSVSGNVIREIHQDHYGNLWIGTEDAGLNKLNPVTGIFTHFQPTGKKGSISYTNIHGMLLTGDELWIGTFEHGLDILNIQTEKVVRHYQMGNGPHQLKSNFIYCIYQTNSGQIILGTTRGAYSYRPKTDDFTVVPGLPQDDWYTSVLKDENGIIWAGTYGNGVHYFNTQTNKSGNFRYDAQNKKSLCNDRVNSVFEDSNHNLWFATESGLCRLNKKTNDFERYTERGFPSNFILSILEDDRKNLWISTSRGLVCLNIDTEKVTVFTKANGLLNDQFNFSSAYKDAEGSMYFGSVKGFISFQPNEFLKNTFIPPVYITGFQINNKEIIIGKNGSSLKKSISYTDKITLKHNQSTFSIDFAALSYTAPEMSEYAYKMDGLDKDWTYLKRNRKAYFTELAPGKYMFKVKASNSSGIWNQQETKLMIVVLPPWWASSLAYSIYFLLGILILFYIVRSYHQRLEEKNKRKIELLEVAKEKELFQAKIEFFTNVAHEIKTPLTLIKGPLEKVMKKAEQVPEIKNSLKIMERNTEKLVELTNELLDFRQTEIEGFRLNFKPTNISELLEETYANFKPLAEQRNISFQLSLPNASLQASVDPVAFDKILNNLFSNAIKYAESVVYVSLLPFNKQDNFFTIEIKNDGYLIPYEMREKIFEPFIRLKETEKQKGTGIGLALSRSLVHLHKGVLELKETENKLNIFYLSMPIRQENETNATPDKLQRTTITKANKDQ